MWVWLEGTISTTAAVHHAHRPSSGPMQLDKEEAPRALIGAPERCAPIGAPPFSMSIAFFPLRTVRAPHFTSIRTAPPLRSSAWCLVAKTNPVNVPISLQSVALIASTPPFFPAYVKI